MNIPAFRPVKIYEPCGCENVPIQATRDESVYMR